MVRQARISTRFEEYLYASKVKRAMKGLPRPVARDGNNIFSLHEVLGIPGCRVVSFDFFDTLFFREHLCLAAVMEKTAELGSSLVSCDIHESLRALDAARGFTSRQLKRRMIETGRGDEPRLRDIFDRALCPHVPDAAERARLGAEIEAIEASVEMRNLVPNEHVHAVFRNLKLLGRRIFVTSDMYLDADALRAILVHHGLMQHVDELLVSSEFGVTKNSGNLFQTVIERAGVPPEEILHVGDNWTNDVVRARERGLKAFHYFNHLRETEVRRQELTHVVETPPEIRRRLIRSRFDLASEKPLKTLDDVVDQVIGPACALFIHDVLHRAVRRQSSDIYFLTRDGTIFKEVADAMQAAVPALYPSRARHRVLACSRTSGMLLGVRRADSDYLYISTEYLSEQRFSFDRFLSLFGLGWVGIETLSPATRQRIAELGDAMELVEFRNLYWQHPDFQEFAMRPILARRGRVERYLDQEGLFAAHRPLLVDIGYSGTWGKQLSTLLAQREAEGRQLPEMAFEFFATNRFFPGNVREMHPSIAMRPGRILDHRRIECLNAGLNYSWLEPFFLDPRLGKLEDFEDHGTIRPRFAPSRLGEESREKVLVMRRQIVERAASFADDLLRHTGDVEEIRALVCGRLTRLIGAPRMSEVAAINGLSHERGMNMVQEQEIARKVSPLRLKSDISHMLHHDHWVQGSLARSGLGLLNRFIEWRYRRNRPEFEHWRP